MLVKSIHYERLRNTGNYENDKLGIDVELEEGELVSEAILRARQVVDNGLQEISKARILEMQAQHDQAIARIGPARK
jgi:hypothetical protein